MSDDDKIKVWIDYVVTQSYLNNDRDLLDVGENKHDFINTIHFPVLGAYWGLKHDIKILNFDDFVEFRLEEWFSKFENRIFKK